MLPPMATTPTPDERGALESVVDAVKPRLRGWLHRGNGPAHRRRRDRPHRPCAEHPGPDRRRRLLRDGLASFGTSAVYHRGKLVPLAAGILKRLDHSNIFLIIGRQPTSRSRCSCSPARPAPCCSSCGSAPSRSAVPGVLGARPPLALHVAHLRRARLARGLLPRPPAQHGGPAIVALIAVGGLLYTLGAVVYGTARPNPSPRLVRLPRGLPTPSPWPPSPPTTWRRR